MIVTKCNELFAMICLGFSSHLCECKYSVDFACYLKCSKFMLQPLIAVGGSMVIFRIITWGGGGGGGGANVQAI